MLTPLSDAFLQLKPVEEKSQVFIQHSCNVGGLFVLSPVTFSETEWVRENKTDPKQNNQVIFI